MFLDFRTSMDARHVVEDSGRSAPLSANVWTWLWVSWTAGTIRFGTGQFVGTSVLVSYRDPSPMIVNFVNVQDIMQRVLGTSRVPYNKNIRPT